MCLRETPDHSATISCARHFAEACLVVLRAERINLVGVSYSVIGEGLFSVCKQVAASRNIELIAVPFVVRHENWDRGMRLYVLKLVT